MNIHLKSYYTRITVILGVLAVVFCFCFLTLGAIANAQTPAEAPAGTQELTGAAGLTQNINSLAKEAGASTEDIRIVIARIIRIALGLLGIIALLITLLGGYLWMTAGGNDEQIAMAKKVLQNGVVGMIIILSSFGIVSLVLRALLGENTGIGGYDSSGVGIADEQNFYGSGTLGGVIKDHYPDRNETNIPRNAKIIVTFRKPIKVSSFADDKNNNGIFGDCINIGASMKWETDCDTLKKGSDLISIKQTKTGEEISGANVLASIEDGGKVYTVVFRPFGGAIGSENGDVEHTVKIGNGVTFDDAAGGNPSIFANRTKNFYDWNFTTNNTLDRQPPYVLSVFPENGSTESKNSVIQIDFNEAIDPTSIQGTFKAETNHYVLSGNTIFLKADNSKVPLGEFRLTNGYRTLEFTPGTACGENACGGTIYCLNVCDKTGATCKSDQYSMLVRTAQTFSADSFESLPFSGVMDVTGNALDRNQNNVVDAVPQTGTVFPDQLKPDNMSWNFTIEDKIDLTAPYLRQVSPGPDAGSVLPDQELSLLFSKRMRVEPMYSIIIEEQPAAAEPLCHVPRTSFLPDGTTLTKLQHCSFNVASMHYYFPIVDSKVEDVKFNCFYPGKGPIETNASSKVSEICDEKDSSGKCCAVDRATGEAFCCNPSLAQPGGLANIDDAKKCIQALRANSPITP